MNAATWLAFGLGAGVGAPTRYLVDTIVQTHVESTQPRGTLTVNVVGSLLLGLIAGLSMRGELSDTVSTAVGTGFCGALTTFSTFAFETVSMADDGAVEDAFKNVALNTVISIAMAGIGYAAILSIY